MPVPSERHLLTVVELHQSINNSVDFLIIRRISAHVHIQGDFPYGTQLTKVRECAVDLLHRQLGYSLYCFGNFVDLSTYGDGCDMDSLWVNVLFFRSCTEFVQAFQSCHVNGPVYEVLDVCWRLKDSIVKDLERISLKEFISDRKSRKRSYIARFEFFIEGAKKHSPFVKEVTVTNG